MVVVGGGVSGLCAALGLVDRGLSVALVEQSGSLAGRAASWRDPTTGDPVTIGPHVFLSEYPNTWRLLERLGTRDRVVWQKGRRVLTVVDGQREVVTRAYPLPAPFHLVPSVLGDPLASLWDKLSNVPVTAWALQLSEEEVEALDVRTGRQVLEELGVSRAYIDYFWAFTSMAILNVPIEEVSAAALFRFYRKLVGRAGVWIGFADGGLGELFEPARGVLEGLGARVLFNARVKRLLGEQDAVEGVELADGRRIRARAVVLAVPPPALQGLLREGWSARFPDLAGLDAFQPCPYISTYLWFDRKLTQNPFWSRPYLPGGLNLDFYDFSNINRGWEHRPSVIGTNAILASRLPAMDDAEVVRRTVDELAEFLPEVRQAKLVHSVVNRIPMAIHRPQPGTERRRPAIAPGPHGLFLAGDWIRTGFPSSMEGAAYAGWRAAEAVLTRLGRARPLARAHPKLALTARLTGQLWNLAPTMRLPRWLSRRGWLSNRAA